MTSRLGATLRGLRQQAGHSLRDVADRLDVHLSTVSSWERGRSEPGVANLHRLADLYGVEVGSLLTRSDDQPGSEGFRPLSPAAAEAMLRRCEELRLAVCLARALGNPRRRERLERVSGIPMSRLEALATGESDVRPAEAAALIRELGVPGQAAWDAGPGPAATLPAATTPSVRRWLALLEGYLAGPGSRQ